MARRRHFFPLRVVGPQMKDVQVRIVMAPPILARPELLVLRIMVCHDATSH